MKITIEEYERGNNVIDFMYPSEMKYSDINRIALLVIILMEKNDFSIYDMKVIIREILRKGYNELKVSSNWRDFNICAMDVLPNIICTLEGLVRRETDATSIDKQFMSGLYYSLTNKSDTSEVFCIDTEDVKKLFSVIFYRVENVDEYVEEISYKINNKKQMIKESMPKTTNDKFFHSLVSNFPDYYAAFSEIGVGFVEAKKLMEEEEYIEIFKEVDKMKKLKNMAALYKNASMGDTAAIKFLLKDVEEDGTKNKGKKGNEDKVNKKKFIDEIPEYLKNPKNTFVPTESEMDGIDRNLTSD